MRIRLDSKDTVQYLYELYRANFDDPNRELHLVLPTRDGLFYFDQTIEPATEVSRAVLNGHCTLEDYNLLLPSRRSRMHKTVMMLSVCALHVQNTPRMLEYFIRNNFLVTDLRLVMRYGPVADSTARHVIACL